MRRSIAAQRRLIERRPHLDSIDRLRVGERNLIGNEPIVVTNLDTQGAHRSLEGWHADTGELLVWRWNEDDERPTERDD
jgi:hypothetical protein